MKKYLVSVEYIDSDTIEVFAENVEEAIEKAKEKAEKDWRPYEIFDEDLF